MINLSFYRDDILYLMSDNLPAEKRNDSDSNRSTKSISRIEAALFILTILKISPTLLYSHVNHSHQGV